MGGGGAFCSVCGIALGKSFDIHTGTPVTETF
jgi:hypothetical protein